MQRALFFTMLLLFNSAIASAQQIFRDTIIEVVNVSPTRSMYLTMLGKERHPRDRKEIYTCPEETRGHYFTGEVMVTLVNRKTKGLINTILIDTNDAENNKLDLPYRIKRGYYKVPKVDRYKEGRPIIMDLKDMNGDGLPHEFAIYNALACMGLDTTLIGYSKKQDKVIQYPIELKTAKGLSKGFWADYLFGHEPNKKGVWKYQIDYRGRGGTLDKYTFRYDRARETFLGELIQIAED